MLLIQATVQASPIHGLGLFASEDVPRGAVIWRFSPGLDMEIGSADFEKLGVYEKEVVRFYSLFIRKTGKYYLAFDDARFINHAEPANVTFDEARGTEDDVEFVLIATREIAAGEELVQNYNEFGDNLGSGQI